jgi:hypothetical protein
MLFALNSLTVKLSPKQLNPQSTLPCRKSTPTLKPGTH